MTVDFGSGRQMVISDLRLLGYDRAEEMLLTAQALSEPSYPGVEAQQAIVIKEAIESINKGRIEIQVERFAGTGVWRVSQIVARAGYTAASRDGYTKEVRAFSMPGEQLPDRRSLLAELDKSMEWERTKDALHVNGDLRAEFVLIGFPEYDLLVKTATILSSRVAFHAIRALSTRIGSGTDRIEYLIS